MATFTMELKEVIASIYGTDYDPDEYEQEYDSITWSGITYGRLPVLPEYDSLGLGTYPIFDENYRKILNGKIIDEYYNREIGTETIDNFKLILRKKMDQIMPFYNQLYESQKIPYSALESMDIHSVGKSDLEGKESADGTSKTIAETNSGTRAVGSDFPQTALAGNADYASNANDATSKVSVDSTLTNDSESTTNSSSNSDTRVTGYQGIASDLITKYRNSLINVDVMILAEIEACFMLVLNNGDEYFALEYYGWW